MKGWSIVRHGAPADVMEFGELPVPEPEAGMVALRVAATALNLPDERLCRGTYQMKPEPPFTPGFEAAGFVEAVGDGVDPGLVGRHVVGVAGPPRGALAEVAQIRSTGLYDLPADIADADAAAMLIAFTTGHLALHRRAKLRAGETLLVHAGAGGVGSAAIQLGVLAGARVIATAGGPAKVQLCLELGAHVAIDYRDLDTKALIAAVQEATGGRGVDVVYDSVGGDVLHASRRVMAREGRLLVVGFASGELADLPTNHALYRNYDVVGVYFGGYSGPEDAGYRREMWEELLGYARAGRIRPVIDRELALDGDVPGALTDLAERRTVGKVVIQVTNPVRTLSASP
ncbi:MAG TPA: NADPH:quinone oxidoreductase family protein [Frankiaceae bacterium]|nr:NADPH:quinone oxidoreductase family protein [Frankiaceae bacterium]